MPLCYKFNYNQQLAGQRFYGRVAYYLHSLQAVKLQQRHNFSAAVLLHGVCCPAGTEAD